VTDPEWAATGTGPQRLTLPWVCSSEHSPTGVIWARNGSNSFASLQDFALNGMTFTEDGQNVRPFVHGDVYAAPNLRGGTKSMAGGPECQTANSAFGGGAGGNEVVGRSGFLGAQYQFTDNLSAFAQVMV